MIIMIQTLEAMWAMMLMMMTLCHFIIIRVIMLGESAGEAITQQNKEKSRNVSIHSWRKKIIFFVTCRCV